MQLKEWAQIAEIVGGIAIVASLVFVGLEVRENTQVVILTSDRAVDQQNVALNISVIENHDVAEILARGETDRRSLDEVDRIRFDNYTFSRFGAYENVVGNLDEGFIDSEEEAVWIEHFRYRFDKPGYRDFWLQYRHGYFPRFRAWIDAIYGTAGD